MKKILVFLLLASIAVTGRSQTPDIKRDEWTAKPALHTLDRRYEKESAIIIQDSRRAEFVDAPNKEIAEYWTLHKIIRVNDNVGIESFNKIYLAVGENSEVVDIRARTILPNGKIVEVDKSNIKDLKEHD